MAYTPTTWTTGDTITATAMNKIENGIAGAGGSPYVYVTAYGFSNYSTLGYFTLGKLKDTNVYERVLNTASSWNPYAVELGVNSSFGTNYVFPSLISTSNLPEGIVLLWVQYGNNANDYTYSGEVSQTLYGYYNDSRADGCRVVTGNFELNAVAD